MKAVELDPQDVVFAEAIKRYTEVAKLPTPC